jgi:hypothetical protein
VLGDKQLASGLRKLEQTTTGQGTAPNRGEILAHIEDHYLIKRPESHGHFEENGSQTLAPLTFLA